MNPGAAVAVDTFHSVASPARPWAAALGRRPHAVPTTARYGLMAKFWVVQPELEALPPGADSIEVPQT